MHGARPNCRPALSGEAGRQSALDPFCQASWSSVGFFVAESFSLWRFRSTSVSDKTGTVSYTNQRERNRVGHLSAIAGTGGIVTATKWGSALLPVRLYRAFERP